MSEARSHAHGAPLESAGEAGPALRPGRATPEGTAAYAARHAALKGAHGPLGSTRLVASRAGFGCYRVARGVAEHAEALRRTLRGGVNLIDTSTNYTDGASEQLVGDVLGELIDAGELRREEVVVVTKAGYIQGQNLAVVEQRRAAGRPFPEVVEYSDGCWYCIHPEFLADQLARSLVRLGLETVDVLLLHNPEYFLSAAAKHDSGRLASATYDEYYRRLSEAFAWMEEQVAAGTIGAYGISSNTFPVAAEVAEFTSLERCWELARRVAGPDREPGFRVAQMPGNLLETGLAGRRTQANGTQSPLEFAAAHSLGVLINRPLNAFGRDRLVRLADVPAGEPVSAGDLAASLAPLATAEGRLRALAPGDSPAALQAQRLLRHSDFLRSNARQIADLEHWKQVAEHQLIPMAQYGVGAVRAVVLEHGDAGQAQEFNIVAHTFLEALTLALQRHQRHFADGARAEVDRQRAALAPVIGPEQAQLSYSQLSIDLLLGLPGEPVVLVGMRHHDYVNDVLGCFAQERERATTAVFLEAGRILESAL